MEPEQSQQTDQPLLRHLLSTQQLNIISQTLAFLDLEELIGMAEVGLQSHSNSVLFQVAIGKAFMAKFLNRVDRGVFFMFYEDQDFRIIEQNNIHKIVTNNYHFYPQAYQSFTNLFRAFQTATSFLDSQEEFQNLVEQLFLEPDLPMPKFKRESVGMFCQTSMQEHICLIKFPTEEFEQMWIEQPLQELKKKLSEQLKQLTNTQKYSELGQSQINRKIRQVRFAAYKVTFENWRTYLIKDFKIHNILVLTLAICSQLVQTYRQMLIHIQDPFMKFSEFALRANIYRNIVISIEEKFNFLIGYYDEFYTSCFKPRPDLPPFNFWRPGLSIWVQRMKVFHPQNQKAYNYISSKLRQNNLKQFLVVKTEKLPSFFSELKRQVDMQRFSNERKQKFYKSTENQVQMQGYFQNNIDMYQTLAKDYIEYMVDISLNELSVHWCGHSQHIIRFYPLFSQFASNVVQETAELYRFIKEITEKSVPKEIRLNIFRQVVKEDLMFSDQRMFKPCIIKQILDWVNSWIQDQIQAMSEFAIFDEEGYSKYKINLDFNEKDGILGYFNNKNNILPDCLNQLRYFYNIQIEDVGVTFPKDKQSEDCNLQEMEQYNSDSQEMVDQKLQKP